MHNLYKAALEEFGEFLMIIEGDSEASDKIYLVMLRLFFYF